MHLDPSAFGLCGDNEHRHLHYHGWCLVDIRRDVTKPTATQFDTVQGDHVVAGEALAKDVVVEASGAGDDDKAEGGEGVDEGGDEVAIGKVANMLDVKGKSGEGEREDEHKEGIDEEVIEEAEGSDRSTLEARGEGEGFVATDISGTTVHHY